MRISQEEKDNTEEILFSYKKLDSQIRQYDIDILLFDDGMFKECFLNNRYSFKLVEVE